MGPGRDQTIDPWVCSQTRPGTVPPVNLRPAFHQFHFFLPFAFFFFLVNFDDSLLTSVTFCFCGNRVSPLGGSTGTFGATGNVSKSRCSFIFSADILSTSIFRASLTIAAFAYSESLFGNSCWFFFCKINKHICIM